MERHKNKSIKRSTLSQSIRQRIFNIVVKHFQTMQPWWWKDWELYSYAKHPDTKKLFIIVKTKSQKEGKTQYHLIGEDRKKKIQYKLTPMYVHAQIKKDPSPGAATIAAINRIKEETVNASRNNLRGEGSEKRRGAA